MMETLSQNQKAREDFYGRLLSVNLLDEFMRRRDPRVDASYVEREDRNQFAAAFIRGLGIQSILNIGGGGKRHLQKHLGSPVTVHEIDITGDCDTMLNLDKVERLPFEDGSFDICCAFDVLEHLEQFHLMTDELYRVSRGGVLISLPNSASEIIANVLRNRPQKRPDMNRGTFSKFYGLPLEPPYDRHRWWLYFQDIIRYFLWFENRNDCKVSFFVPKPSWKQQMVRVIFGRHFYYTFICPHVWIHIVKK